MRALVYTDLQATDGHEKCYHDPTKPLQLWRVAKLYDDLLRIYKEHRCDCLWDLGDTTDDRSAIPVPAIDAVCSKLAKFPASQWNVKLIGNHEQYLRNTKVTVGQLFSSFFNVYEQNTMVSTGEGTYLLLCPYPAQEEDTVKWLAQQKTRLMGKKTILLGHFQLAGCYGAGGQLPTGVLPEDVQFVTLGLLGHIHKPQQMGRVFYVGSPFQQNWGESGEDKRVAIVDTRDCTVEWIPLEGYPRYLEVGLEDFTRCATIASEDRYRVVLKSQAEAATFFAHPLAHLAQSEYDFDVSGASTSTDTEVEGGAWSSENIMRRYVERNRPEDRGLDITVEEMLEIGLQIVSS